MASTVIAQSRSGESHSSDTRLATSMVEHKKFFSSTMTKSQLMKRKDRLTSTTKITTVKSSSKQSRSLTTRGHLPTSLATNIESFGQTHSTSLSSKFRSQRNGNLLTKNCKSCFHSSMPERQSMLPELTPMSKSPTKLSLMKTHLPGSLATTTSRMPLRFASSRLSSTARTNLPRRLSLRDSSASWESALRKKSTMVLFLTHQSTGLILLLGSLVQSQSRERMS